MLLWSGVGGQLLSSCCCGQGLVVSYCHELLSSCCCGQGLVVSYCHHVAVVRGWWSAIFVSSLSSSYCGQKLVVNCAHVQKKDPFATLSRKIEK